MLVYGVPPSLPATEGIIFNPVPRSLPLQLLQPTSYLSSPCKFLPACCLSANTRFSKVLLPHYYTDRVQCNSVLHICIQSEITFASFITILLYRVQHNIILLFTESEIAHQIHQGVIHTKIPDSNIYEQKNISDTRHQDKPTYQTLESPRYLIQPYSPETAVHSPAGHSLQYRQLRCPDSAVQHRADLTLTRSINILQAGSNTTVRNGIFRSFQLARVSHFPIARTASIRLT